MGHSSNTTAPKSSAVSTYGREYVWPTKPPHEFVVPSVTTILKHGLPKTALPYWAAQLVAEYAYDHVQAWRDLPREDAIDLLKRSPYRSIRQKAALGTSVHAAIESFLSGRRPIDVPEEQMGYCDAARSFLSDTQLTILRTEATIFSRTHRYAGTADLLGELAGQPILVDFKTGTGIYPEFSLQLAAYAHGDFIGDEHDTETPLTALGAFEQGVIVRLLPDGSYEQQTVRIDQQLFEVFRGAKEIFHFKRDQNRWFVGDDDR
jgi:hypothetical protein